LLLQVFSVLFHQIQTSDRILAKRWSWVHWFFETLFCALCEYSVFHGLNASTKIHDSMSLRGTSHGNDVAENH